MGLLLFVFVAMLGVEVYGFATSHLFSQEIWYPVGLERLVRFTGLYLAAATPVLIFVPWAFLRLAAGLALVLTAVAVGPLAVLATAFFLISCCSLGARVVGSGMMPRRPVCATLAGMAVYIFLMGLAARLPVNYWWVYAAVLAIPIALDLPGPGRLACWRDSPMFTWGSTWGERASAALLVYVLAMHWLVVLKPETSADGLSMHLAVPANIAAHHALTFAPARFLWAVMPMGADWSYSVVYVLGGEFAARLLNFAMLLAVVALLYDAVRRWVGPATAYLLTALFAATPMVQLVTGSLFVENLQAALILAAMTLLWHFGESRDRRLLYAAALLAGTAMAVKFGSAAFLVAALPFAIMEGRRHWKSCAVAGLLFLATALPPYAIAWWKTGNPVFPFLYRQIQSPLLNPSANIADIRYHRPAAWRAAFDLTFHTSRLYEGQNGSFGFQYLLLAPLGLAGLFVTRRQPAVVAAVVGLGGAILVMSIEPNARYLYAALPLISVPAAAALGWLGEHRRRFGGVAIGYLVACALLNVYFLPSSNFYHKDFYLRAPFSSQARQQYIRAAIPTREAIAYLNSHHPKAAALWTSDSFIADFAGEPYENHWHQFTTLNQIRQAGSVPDLLKLLDQWQVQYFVAHKPRAGDFTTPPVLRSVLDNCTLAEQEFGQVYVARLQPGCPQALSQPLLIAQRGTYDDFEPRIEFRGEWLRDDQFDSTYAHTVTYSDTPGSEIGFAFEGTALTYIFTRVPNRGLAEVLIDGASKATVDLYAPLTEWQSRLKFGGLAPGRHLAVIRVLGRRRAGAEGQYVDLDCFEVE